MIKRKRSGFSLIEVIFFIVVVSVSVVGVLLVMNTVVSSSADPMVRKQAIAIAESMLEEILLKEYAKPTGSTSVAYGVLGWSRDLFDCVDDYTSYTTAGGMVDAAGTAIAGLEKYDLSPISVSATSDLTGVTAKKITVTVTGPNVSISLTGYRASY